jgi:hypothetical protein
LSGFDGLVFLTNNTIAATINTAHQLTVNGGLSFPAVTAASPGDFSKQIELYAGGGYGFSVTAGLLNIVTGAAGVIGFYVGTTLVGAISANGIMSGPAGSPTWTTGSAAPAANVPVGSLYSRVGGAVGATLYVSRGSGTWAAVAGV